MGCVRETPHRKVKPAWDKRNSPDKNEASTGCLRETPQIKKKEASMGCVRETPHRKLKAAWHV